MASTATPIRLPASRFDLLAVVAAAHPDPDAARTAWHRLVRDLGGVRSAESYLSSGHARALVPLLAGRAELLGFAATTRETLGAETAVVWGANERLLALCAPSIEGLAAAGIHVGLLGAAALLGDGYPHHRERRLIGLDLLVHPSRHADAVQTLTALGWTSGLEAPRRPPRDPARDPRPTALRDPSETVWIVLHVRPVRAQPIRRAPLDDIELIPLAPSHPLAAAGAVRPTPALLAVDLAAQATRPNRAWRVRWMVDVHRAITLGDFDAASTATQARERGVGLQVAAALAAAGEVLPLPDGLIPASFEPGDEAARRAELTRLAAAARSARLHGRGGAINVLRRAWHAARSRTDRGDLATLLALVAGEAHAMNRTGRGA